MGSGRSVEAFSARASGRFLRKTHEVKAVPGRRIRVNSRSLPTSSLLRSSLLASTVVSAGVLAVNGNAVAACLGENTASVLCNTANPATGGALATTFNDASLVTLNSGANISAGANATVTAGSGLLRFNHNDPAGVAGGITLTHLGAGDVTYTGTGNVAGGISIPVMAGAASITQSAGLVTGGISVSALGGVTINTVGSQIQNSSIYLGVPNLGANLSIDAGAISNPGGDAIRIQGAGGNVAGDIFIRTHEAVVGNVLHTDMGLWGRFDFIADANIDGEIRLNPNAASRSAPTNITFNQDFVITTNNERAGLDVRHSSSMGAMTMRTKAITGGRVAVSAVNSPNSLIVDGSLSRGTWTGAVPGMEYDLALGGNVLGAWLFWTGRSKRGRERKRLG
jgi:hypothetical protein